MTDSEAAIILAGLRAELLYAGISEEKNAEALAIAIRRLLLHAAPRPTPRCAQMDGLNTCQLTRDHKSPHYYGEGEESLD